MKSSKLYSYFLVSIQFVSIGAMLFFEYRLLTNVWVLLLLFIGLGIGLSAIKAQKRFNVIPEIHQEGCLITHGIYNYIRHPMYFSLLVSFFGFFIFGSEESRFFYILMLIALFLKAKKEEKLWHCHDKNYAKYKQRTKMFIPFIL